MRGEEYGYKLAEDRDAPRRSSNSITWVLEEFLFESGKLPFLSAT